MRTTDAPANTEKGTGPRRHLQGRTLKGARSPQVAHSRPRTAPLTVARAPQRHACACMCMRVCVYVYARVRSPRLAPQRCQVGVRRGGAGLARGGHAGDHPPGPVAHRLWRHRGRSGGGRRGHKRAAVDVGPLWGRGRGRVAGGLRWQPKNAVQYGTESRINRFQYISVL
jgi:hypothetical protein